jgi:enamine deaminase RidA (YjgF/YER057c/UK114 family)
MKNHRLLALITVAAFTASHLLWAGKKKKPEEEITQTLELPPEPPSAVTAETARLVFSVARMSSKGLLSQQVREGLKALLKTHKRDRIVKIRAFVAGSGDMRRVQPIVSEVFSDKHLSLPTLSVVQVGDLPMQGAQVVLEAIAESRKAVNPYGLAFISGQSASSDQPLLKVAPLVQESIGKLNAALQSVGLSSKEVLRVTCFCSSIDDVNQIRRAVATQFPKAALDYVQQQRAYTRGHVECEAVARLLAPVGEPLRFVNPESLSKSPNYSQIALVGARRVVLTGTQLAFRYQDSDVRLAFERLRKALEEVKASFSGVAMSSVYPLSAFMSEKVQDLRFEFYDKSSPPASTVVLFQGLPALDASFAVDVVAVLPESNPS